jgi:hypothetical protein
LRIDFEILGSKQLNKCAVINIGTQGVDVSAQRNSMVAMKIISFTIID